MEKLLLTIIFALGNLHFYLNGLRYNEVEVAANEKTFRTVKR